MSCKQFQLAFDEAARELSFEGSLDEDGCATVVSPVAEVPQVHVCYLNETDVAVLTAEIGFVPSDDLALLRMFLQDNYFTGATRGAVFAMDPDGRVVLQRELPTGGLDGRFLAEALADFAGTAFVSRRRLYRSVDGNVAAENTEEADVDLPKAGFLQV